MFAERFDALMNIAEVSNSLLGRDVNMNPSYSKHSRTNHFREDLAESAGYTRSSYSSGGEGQNK